MTESLTDAQRLKFRLLSEGVQITAAGEEALHQRIGDRSLSPADYASTSGLILQLEDDVWVNAPIERYNPNFVSATPYFLDTTSDGFVVHGEGFVSTARYWPQPAYHGTHNEYGLLNNFVVTHGDRARLSPLRGCAMTCTFCNIPYDDPISEYGLKGIEAIVSAARAALDDSLQPARHMLISGGTPKPKDISYIQDVYRTILRTFPTLEVDIMMVPLKDLFDLPGLKSLGVNELSINIEVYNQGRAKSMMRQKYNQGIGYYLNFIAEAAEVLGVGKVRSMLMVGLEPMEDTLAGVAAIAERGGVPVLSPFRPDPATPLKAMKPPTGAELEETYLRAQEIVRAAGGVLGPDCPPCTHNTLTFAPDNGVYRHPIPAMI